MIVNSSCPGEGARLSAVQTLEHDSQNTLYAYHEDVQNLQRDIVFYPAREEDSVSPKHGRSGILNPERRSMS